MKKYAKVALVVLLAFLLPWAATFAEETVISDDSDAAQNGTVSVEQDGMTFSLAAEADEENNVSIHLGLDNPDQVSFSDMEATLTLPEGMSLSDTDGETEQTIPIDPQGDGTKVTLMLGAQIDSAAADTQAPDDEDAADVQNPEEEPEDNDAAVSDPADEETPDENVDEPAVEIADPADATDTNDTTETADPSDELTDAGSEEDPASEETTTPVSSSTFDPDETIVIPSATTSGTDTSTAVATTPDTTASDAATTTDVTQSGSNVKTGIENLSLGLMILGLAFAVILIGLYAKHHKGSSGRFLSIALAFLMLGFGLPMIQDVEAADVERSVTLNATLTVNDVDYPITATVVYQIEDPSDETADDESQTTDPADADAKDVTADTTDADTQDETTDPADTDPADADQTDSDQKADTSDTTNKDNESDQTKDDADVQNKDSDDSADVKDDAAADDTRSDTTDTATDTKKEDSSATDSKTDTKTDTAAGTTDQTDTSEKTDAKDTSSDTSSDTGSDTSSDSKPVSYSGEIHTATRSIAYTTDGTETVREIIANSGVSLGGYDLTEPGLDEKITQNNQTITVTRIAYKTKTETESIPYGTYEYEDSSIETGKTKVKQAGVAGEKTYTYKVKYVNGVATDEKELISEEVTKEMVSEIILVGTGPKTSTTSSGTNSDGAKLVKTSGGLGWYWPIDGNAGGCFLITSLMGTRESPGGIGSTNHQGTDIAADNRSMILAVQNGRVTQSGWNSGYGNSVTIVTSDGYTVLYGHLSQCNVSVGNTVTAGQTVGLEGSTGNSTGPHLHFEVRLNGTAINGLSLYGEDIYNKLSYALDA